MLGRSTLYFINLAYRSKFWYDNRIVIIGNIVGIIVLIVMAIMIDKFVSDQDYDEIRARHEISVRERAKLQESPVPFK